MAAELPQAAHPVGVRAGQDSAERAGTADQSAGLPGGHGQVVGDRHLVLLLEGDVAALPLHQLHQRADEFLDRRPGLGLRGLGEDTQRGDQQRVPGEDRRGGTEQRPGGGPVAAQRVAVDDVVVQQGEVVDQFHGHGAGHRVRGAAADGHGRQQGECRTDHLAAAAGGRTGLAVGLAPAPVVPRHQALLGGQRLHRRPQGG